MHTERVPSQESGQKWDANQYAANGRFVADLASDVVALLDPKPAERILDLGCGDGVLGELLSGMGAHVVGCDRDTSMLEAAAARGLETVAADMTNLPFSGQFDAVFSNASLHWTRDQKAVLQGVRKALVHGGRFVAEMGGFGNIASIRVALRAVAAQYGIDAEERAASFYPTVETYRALLESSGFLVEHISLHPRPTLLKCGMAEWLRTFRRAMLEELSEQDQAALVNRTVELLEPVLRDEQGNWWGDYVRLRFRARLPT